MAGILQVNAGSLKNVRNVTIQPGGLLNGGSGLIEVGGNWSNSGSFASGTGTVNFRDLCAGGSATINGNTTFHRASFVTATGKNYVFAAGSTQMVTSVLEIAGTASTPIQFRSSALGQVAFVNLLVGGTQLIQHVGVTDVWATGQWLAPFQTNEGGGGNANRWFGTPSGPGTGNAANAIPTLDTAALAVLAALLAAAGAWFARRRTAANRISTRQKRDRDTP
ncbi:MAG TPA: IPTL-CTERM sorting domain-containing protein [Casimicrobiaceae bacterium]|nr:IPTL-CTERM sorting domain-containing protein [Casimicrobiaceae bacterium]